MRTSNALVTARHTIDCAGAPASPGLFPNEASLRRLTATLAAETSQEWENRKNLPQHEMPNPALKFDARRILYRKKIAPPESDFDHHPVTNVFNLSDQGYCFNLNNTFPVAVLLLTLLTKPSLKTLAW